jgi:cytochrome b-561
MFVILGRNPDLSYPILISIAELFGLISLILVGLFFPENGFYPTYNWTTNPFSYHPLMMTIGLLFCYGNAIILYRTFKQTPKYGVKVLHASFLIISFVFAAIGLAAIVRSKNLGNRPHFMTYHSWMGLITLCLFGLQWILGFVSFLIPRLSLDFRKAYMPR